MKIRSIKASINLIIFVITGIGIFVLLTGIFIFTSSKYDHQYHRILNLEYSFFQAMEEEGTVLDSPDTALLEILKNKYNLLAAENDQLSIKNGRALIEDRQNYYYALHERIQQTIERRRAVQSLLPELIESVRYINNHHIVNLQNLLRRGQDTQDWDTSEAFQRSSVRAAPETVIIRAASDIQNHLLMVLETFNKLQAGVKPSSLIHEFRSVMEKFHESVNTFEDYTLDAQDGLLVEELLLNGRKFQENFTIMLHNETAIKELTKALEGNRKQMLAILGDERHRIGMINHSHRRNLLILIGATLFALVILFIFLSYYGQRIIRGFRTTVEQTLRIQDDLSYPIRIRDDEFEEFQLVLKTLDGMSETIKTQMDDLEGARKNLSRRVKERTLELEQTNIRLRAEIYERIAEEEKRIELETRLRRSEKMEAIGLLAGGVAHDLNNILSGVISYPEMLLIELPEDSPYREPIELILESGEKAASVVDDLLTLARRGVSITKVMNLNDVVDAYLKSPEFKLLKNEYPLVTLECDLYPDLLNLKGSAVHLSKTLMNLVSNAFEAIVGPGEIHITTTNKYVDVPLPGYDDINEGDYVTLTVSDTGSGLSSEDMKRIFEPFYTKKVMGRSGTGLGMAVVWGTVKDHKGYIDIISQEGRGASFYLYFPATRRKIEEQEDDQDLKKIMGHGENVLIIDDIEEQRIIAGELLETLGYNVATACSGEEALEYLGNHSADLLLLDMIMEPGMDGLETYSRILENFPDQKALIASGYSETSRVKLTLELGAGGYLKKPYTIFNLGHAVKGALRKRRDEPAS